jgi:hypothetical protein
MQAGNAISTPARPWTVFLLRLAFVPDTVAVT